MSEMNNKKYQIAKRIYIDFIHPSAAGKRPVRLYQIIALQDFINPFFGQVKAGDTGGFIRSEENLSHDGLCWVGHSAKIFDDAVVSGNSIVQDDAAVYGLAIITGDSIIKDRAHIRGSAKLESCRCQDLTDVFGSPTMHNVVLHNSSRIYDSPTVTNTTMYDGSMIHGEAIVSNSVLREISEVRGDAKINKSELTGRSLALAGVHNNTTLHGIIDLEINSGKGELRK